MSSDLLERNVDQAIAAGRRQITHPTQSWLELCQAYVRGEIFDVAAWAAAAHTAWDLIPPRERIDGGSPFDLPRGYAIYFANRHRRPDGSRKPGHVAFTIGKLTKSNCLSNDYKRRGMIDVVPRSFIGWDLVYLGASTWTPFGELKPGSAELWDGVVPPKVNIDLAEMSALIRNTASWRLACRLYDLGFYDGKPRPLGQQGYPMRAVVNLQKSRGWAGTGEYGQRTHEAAFPV